MWRRTARSLAQISTARTLPLSAIHATAELRESNSATDDIAQLWADRDDGQKTARKFPLRTADGAPVANLAQAKESAGVLRNERREKKLSISRHKPKFADNPRHAGRF